MAIAAVTLTQLANLKVTNIVPEDALKTSLDFIASFSSIPGLEWLGPAVGFLNAFLPDRQHEEIMGAFNKLGQQVERVRSDIKQTQDVIEAAAMRVAYSDAFSIIRESMDKVSKMSVYSKTNPTVRNDILTELMQSEEPLQNGLNKFLQGVDSNRENDASTFCIMKSLYDKLDGDAPKLRMVVAELVQLLCSGFVALATIFLHKYGNLNVYKALYNDKMDNAVKHINKWLDKVKSPDEFTKFMDTDMKNAMGDGDSNADIADSILAKASAKYDFLYLIVHVYDDLLGYENHYINGSYKTVLHYNDKCAVIYYRFRSYKPKYGADTLSKVDFVMGTLFHSRADTLYDMIKSALSRQGLQYQTDYWGISCTESSVNMQCRSNWEGKFYLQTKFHPYGVYDSSFSRFIALS